MPRKRGPTPEQIRRRRLTALVLIVGTLLAVVVAIVVALPHVRHKSAPTTTAIVLAHQFRIVFPEGFTRAQMAKRVHDVALIAEHKSGKPVLLKENAYLAATKKIFVPCVTPHTWTHAEGFLFPATYDFDATTTSAQLVTEQIEAFCQNWKTVDLAYAKSKNLTSYDVLNIASMIERETLAPDERRLVAAVIYNRLHDRMPLGIDATLRYGLNISPEKSILESQLQNPTPYNTRLHLGLPPTPIANPGLASIQAAAHPAKVDYLYFVRKPDKVHNFFTASATAFAQYECAHGYGCG
ncbi:MAG TPA: endolytic transglycosylase MltG [Gaiellaceae bacterium]|nr:endolytic transglycosylase MltG [Gaiellaceae bacterium]